jgi:microcystin-dependent protein
MYLTPDSAALSSDVVCRALAIPIDLWPYAVGAIEQLANEWNWEAYGDAPIEDLTGFFDLLIDTLGGGCVIMAVGTIIPHARATLPDNWLPCDGSSHLRTDFPDLYAVLDAAFITDADHFTTPNLQARFVAGAGSGGGLALDPGDSGGEAEHTLSVAEMPAHAHTITTEGVTEGYVGGVVGLVPIDNVPDVTGSTGGGGAHNNMPPFLALDFAIVARVQASGL